MKSNAIEVFEKGINETTRRLQLVEATVESWSNVLDTKLLIVLFHIYFQASVSLYSTFSYRILDAMYNCSFEKNCDEIEWLIAARPELLSTCETFTAIFRNHQVWLLPGASHQVPVEAKPKRFTIN